MEIHTEQDRALVRYLTLIGVILIVALVASAAFAQTGGSITVNSDVMCGLNDPHPDYVLDVQASGDVEFKGAVIGLPEPKPLELPNTDWILFYFKVLIAQMVVMASAAIWWIRRIAARTRREIEERIAEVVITLDEHERWARVMQK